MISIPTVSLNDQTTLPEVGLGTYELDGAKGIDAMVSAIEVGYRLLDSAVNYKNEREVGEAVRASGIPRNELLVTTKIPGRDHGFDKAKASVDGSLERLGLDHIDVLLIHWPNPSVDQYVQTWQAMVELREQGVVRTIGVSNFTERMLQRLVEETGVVPAINQVELHPYFPQAALRAVHAELGIRTESWSPLAKRSELLGESVITDIAAAHGVTPTQVVVRWHVQLGSTPIPKSSSADRQRENADVFGFELTEAEVAAISALERGRLWGADPERGRLWGADPDTHEET